MTKSIGYLGIWLGFGALASWVALSGAFNSLYQLFHNEPETLTLGLGLTVISLVGIVHFARRSPWWCLVPATCLAILVTAGMVADSTVLLLGLTIPGFY
ncbi:hypothetical protein [Levilactobacillus tongjiangensis]|uniref:Uncharacterized protein n=1 Tax=Levilactobacillus tongjiangensis TaxID=2486023 RepID=A0ABW1SRK2_9LACO|nr:hypothetical protein [Levilactobacillus tongjiangensis]